MTMRTRNILVSLLAIACALALVATGVSAVKSNLVTIETVKVKDIVDKGTEDISVRAGETIPVQVFFRANENASDVRMNAEIEGTKVDVEEDVFLGDLEKGKRYSETITIQVPYELQDEVSEDITLEIEIGNGDFETEHPDIVLRVKRVPYSTEVMSINSDSSVKAGNLFPVDVVLKNVGYNKLDDLDVTVSIPLLQISRTVYFGDIASLETDEEDDTIRGRVFLRTPYDAASGIYKLQIDIENDDLKETASKDIFVENNFASNIVVSDSRKDTIVGQDIVYELLVVNPTNSLKLYRFVVESPKSVEVTSSNTVVAIPAGTSKVVKVTANAEAEGEYEIDVNIFSGESLVETVKLNLNAGEGRIAGTRNSTIILTVVLAVVFVVLLAVFVVLMTRKPKKTEEIGESYY